MYPNLKLELWRTGLRQNQLAKLLQIDDTQLSKIMNGFREPNPEIRRRIAEMLHADEAWLFEPSGDHPGRPPLPETQNQE